MSYRIAAAQISHETNVFSSVRTDLAAFRRSGLLFGDDIIARERDSNSAFGGFLTGAARLGFDLVPLMSVWATPSGLVTAEAIEYLATELRSRIEAASSEQPIDGLLLALHGAMVSDLDRDGDGFLLEIARSTVGSNTPIVATLDLHANISVRMLAAADMLIGYDTYPHVDMAERADEACDLIIDLIRGDLVPTTSLVKPPMMPTSQRMTTDHEPMRRLFALAHQFETNGVVNVTIAGGFPPADVPECGLSVLVTTHNDPDLANACADEIASLAWKHRDEFLGGVSSFDDAAEAIRALPNGTDLPLVIVDIGDNPWSGGPGDSAEIIRFLVELGVQRAAVAVVVDPEVVKHCLAAGIGETVNVSLGGKTDELHGPPLQTVATVISISDGRYVNYGPMMAGLPVDLGPTVVLEIGDPPVLVIVTSFAETPIDLNVFRSNGIEPTTLRVIGLKGKGHFRAAFEPIASQVILVEGPGITGSDLSRLPFQHLERPIWPLDLDTQYD